MFGSWKRVSLCFDILVLVGEISKCRMKVLAVKEDRIQPPSSVTIHQLCCSPNAAAQIHKIPSYYFYERYDSVIMIMHAAGYWGMFYDLIFKRLHTGAKTLKVRYSPTGYLTPPFRGHQFQTNPKPFQGSPTQC